jgi:hypothetical protein
VDGSRVEYVAECFWPGVGEAELRALGRADGARDLRIQIATHEAAEHDRDHNPVGDPGETSELEAGVQGDERRGGDSGDDVKIQPVPGFAEPAEPFPALSQAVGVEAQEHQCAGHANADARQPAGAQQWM